MGAKVSEKNPSAGGMLRKIYPNAIVPNAIQKSLRFLRPKRGSRFLSLDAISNLKI